jgi:hypothetical protein
MQKIQMSLRDVCAQGKESRYISCNNEKISKGIYTMRYLMLTYYYQANGKINEGMIVTNRVRPKDWQTTNVILDFKELKVIKASLRDNDIPKDWERIVGYYYPFYTNIMERLLQENGHELLMESISK